MKFQKASQLSVQTFKDDYTVFGFQALLHYKRYKLIMKQLVPAHTRFS